MRTSSIVVVLVALGWARSANAAKKAQEPVHGFAQVGIGLVEIGHVEAGAFIGRHLTLEAMASQDAVFGGRYGGGVMALIGHAQGPRPPRHSLLVDARLMLNSDATFDNHGDDLSSYGVIPVGYGFLADNGFFF